MDLTRRKQRDYLTEYANEARRQAMLLPAGKLRDALLSKVRQYEAELSKEKEVAEA